MTRPGYVPADSLTPFEDLPAAERERIAEERLSASRALVVEGMEYAARVMASAR